MLGNHRTIVVIGISNMLLLTIIINPGYAQDGINIKGFLGINPIGLGQLISPSQDNPLIFEISSGKSYSAYTCKIIKIDEDLFNDILDNIANTNINIIGEDISDEICGSGTDTTVDYPQSFADGLYVFQAIGTDSEGFSTKSNFPFEVLGGQFAGGPAAATQVITDVAQFWRKCSALPGGESGANAITKVFYELEGKVNLHDIDFSNKKLKVKIITNTLTDRLDGEVGSGSNDQDLTIETVDTRCFYGFTEQAGQLEQVGPAVGFTKLTLASWNPPVPQCPDSANKNFYREITYWFTVDDKFNDLKNAKTKDILLRLIVDHIPKKEDDLVVDAELFLGKDKDKEVEIHVSSDPKVECSGKVLIVGTK